MVVDRQIDEARTDLVFHALSDPTRRDIIRRVLVEEQSVSALARRYPMSIAAVQKHVAVLDRAELVMKRRRGREQLVHGNRAALRNARRALDQVEALWRMRLEQANQIFDEQTEGGRP